MQNILPTSIHHLWRGLELDWPHRSFAGLGTCCNNIVSWTVCIYWVTDWDDYTIQELNMGIHRMPIIINKSVVGRWLEKGFKNSVEPPFAEGQHRASSQRDRKVISSRIYIYCASVKFRVLSPIDKNKWEWHRRCLCVDREDGHSGSGWRGMRLVDRTVPRMWVIRLR